MAGEQSQGDSREAARPHRDLTPEILEELRSISDSLSIIARAAAQYIEPRRSPLGKVEPRFDIQSALYDARNTALPTSPLINYKARKQK